MRAALHWLANLGYLAAAVLYAPVLLYQMVVQRKNRRGWAQRFGYVPARRSSGARCVWIHAVSLGEVNATRTLVAQLPQCCPGVEVLLSSTTDTGFARARQLYPDQTVLRYPLDFSWIIHRTLDRVRPSLIVLMELEVWYNLVTLAASRGIPVAVANGRFTARSAARLQRLGGLVRPMFSSLRWVGAQSEVIASRFRELGTPADRVEVVGSLKWDTARISDHVGGQEALGRAMGVDARRPLVVLGSSGPGEELQMLAAWEALGERRPQLAIVPRKPERFEEVARLIESRGYACIRRSRRPDSASADPDVNLASDADCIGSSHSRVLLGDTMGELGKFYGLAAVVVVGRTLVPMGGSDPMEVAALGKPMIAGPHTENFADPVARLQEAGAAMVLADCADLTAGLSRIVGDEARRQVMGRRGQQVVRENQGATARTLSRLGELLATSRE